MRLLILGANGQLGTDLTRAAGARPGDFSVTALTRADVDLSDRGTIRAAIEAHTFDVLVNCTGYHKTDEVESNAQRAVDINAFAVRDLAAACMHRGARFVHFSTDYVFDGRSSRPYSEHDRTGPLNVYGTTKAMGESLAGAAHDDTVVFRVASLFGVAGASGKGGNFVETMIRVGREKGRLRVVRDQVMSPTSTADVAGAVLEAIHRRVPPGTYHAVNSGQASWHEFASRIIQRSGVGAVVEPIPAAEYPLPAQRPAFSVLDNSRLSSIVGPIPPWTDALDRYLREKGHLEP